MWDHSGDVETECEHEYHILCCHKKVYRVARLTRVLDSSTPSAPAFPPELAKAPETAVSAYSLRQNEGQSSAAALTGIISASEAVVVYLCILPNRRLCVPLQGPQENNNFVPPGISC